jgi:hypothetical protein
MKYIIALFIVFNISFSQTKIPQSQNNNHQRYIIYEVEKLTAESHSTNDAPQQTSGTNKNLIMLDSETGKTWYLTAYTTVADPAHNLNHLKYEWTPIKFSKEFVGQLLPPKELEK